MTINVALKKNSQNREFIVRNEVIKIPTYKLDYFLQLFPKTVPKSILK